MIGLISSTIYPSDAPLYWGSPRSSIPAEERLEQTKKTISSLTEAGIKDVFLADNSGINWIAGTEELLKPARVHIYNHHQFQNKGISEIYLLLNVLPYLPKNTPILKISGRYFLNGRDFLELDYADILVKLYKPSPEAKYEMSTRCYLVKDKDVLETFLRQTLRDLYSSPSQIVGVRSFLKLVRNSLLKEKDNYPYDDPMDAIEKAAARVLERKEFCVRYVETLGIEGLSGDNAKRLIRE